MDLKKCKQRMSTCVSKCQERLETPNFLRNYIYLITYFWFQSRMTCILLFFNPKMDLEKCKQRISTSVSECQEGSETPNFLLDYICPITRSWFHHRMTCLTEFFDLKIVSKKCKQRIWRSHIFRLDDGNSVRPLSFCLLLVGVSMTSIWSLSEDPPLPC